MHWILVLFLLAIGCPTPDPCMPNTTRCPAERNVAEICSADGEWLELLDCGDLGVEGWKCCRTAEGCSCLPVGDPECVR